MAHKIQFSTNFHHMVSDPSTAFIHKKTTAKILLECLQEKVYHSVCFCGWSYTLSLRQCALCFWTLPSCTHIGGHEWKRKQENHHAHSFLMILLQHFNALALFNIGLCRHLKLRPTMGSGLCCSCQSHTNKSWKPNPFSHFSCFKENIKINEGQGGDMTDLWDLGQQSGRPLWYLMHLNVELFHNIASKSFWAIADHEVRYSCQSLGEYMRELRCIAALEWCPADW